jgi:hypothetical protein
MTPKNSQSLFYVCLDANLWCKNLANLILQRSVVVKIPSLCFMFVYKCKHAVQESEQTDTEALSLCFTFV